MSLWNRIGDFFHRNRKTFLIVGAVGGAAVVVTSLVRRHYNQLTKNLEEEHLAKIRMSSFFENAQRTCDETVQSFLPQLQAELFKLLYVPSPDELRLSLSGSREEKCAVWDNLKATTFARTVGGLYSLVLLSVLLKVQLNIISRFMYLDSLVVRQGGESSLGKENQMGYLSYSVSYFINNSIAMIADRTNKAAEEVLADYALTKKITLEDMRTIFARIREKFETPTQEMPDPFNQLFLPKENENGLAEDQNNMTMLVNETRDILESERFKTALKKCLGTVFGMTENDLSVYFTPTEETPTVQLAMAKVIPCVNKQIDIILHTGDDDHQNEYLMALTFLQELSDLSRLIFTRRAD